jgi:hypothetical protein
MQGTPTFWEENVVSGTPPFTTQCAEEREWLLTVDMDKDGQLHVNREMDNDQDTDKDEDKV